MIMDVDIGNSRVKWLLRDATSVLDSGVSTSVEDLITRLRDGSSLPQRTRVCCVGESRMLDTLDAWLESNRLPKAKRAVTTAYAARVTNGYDQPERLGVDRWLALCAAWNRSVGPTVVVDAGSAMTVDFVDVNGQHCGGYIVPGIAMQQNSLISNTQLVRFDTDLSGVHLAPGRCTANAVNNGIACMLKAMIESSVESFRRSSGQAPKLFLTGGDAAMLSAFLQVPYFLEPDLVLEGINLVMPQA